MPDAEVVLSHPDSTSVETPSAVVLNYADRFSRIKRILLGGSVRPGSDNSLDGLRGIAVIYVLLSHLAHYGIHLIPGVNFIGSGKYGVYLFFVLSAYLLSMPFFRQARTGEIYPGHKFLFDYSIRRFLRIFPLYTLVLAVCVVMTMQGLGDWTIPMSTSEFLNHLLLQEGKSIFWTIPVEFTFYFFLPVFALTGVSFDRLIPFGALIFFSLCLLLVQVIWPAVDYPLNGIQLGPYLQLFLVGMLVARFVAQENLLNQLFARYAKWLQVTGWLASLLVVVTLPKVWGLIVGEELPLNHFHKSYWLYAILWGLVVLASRDVSSVLRRTLSWYPLVLVGKASFSIYLIHMTVIQSVKQVYVGESQLVLLALILVSVSVIAFLSYRLIEKPFYQLAHFDDHPAGDKSQTK